MRVKTEQMEFLKQIVESLLPGASVFLFGSRIFDHMKGGDIDLLVLGKRQLTGKEKRKIKIDVLVKSPILVILRLVTC